jgi:hypothetical protein
VKQRESAPCLSIEEYDRLAEIAARRLAEMEFTAQESELILGLCRENRAGSTHGFIGGWTEDQGVIAGATWTRSALEKLLRDARRPGQDERDARAARWDLRCEQAKEEGAGL